MGECTSQNSRHCRTCGYGKEKHGAQADYGRKMKIGVDQGQRKSWNINENWLGLKNKMRQEWRDDDPEEENSERRSLLGCPELSGVRRVLFGSIGPRSCIGIGIGPGIAFNNGGYPDGGN